MTTIEGQFKGDCVAKSGHHTRSELETKRKSVDSVRVHKCAIVYFIAVCNDNTDANLFSLNKVETYLNTVLTDFFHRNARIVCDCFTAQCDVFVQKLVLTLCSENILLRRASIQSLRLVARVLVACIPNDHKLSNFIRYLVKYGLSRFVPLNVRITLATVLPQILIAGLLEDYSRSDQVQDFEPLLVSLIEAFIDAPTDKSTFKQAFISLAKCLGPTVFTNIFKVWEHYDMKDAYFAVKFQVSSKWASEVFPDLKINEECTKRDSNSAFFHLGGSIDTIPPKPSLTEALRLNFSASKLRRHSAVPLFCYEDINQLLSPQAHTALMKAFERNQSSKGDHEYIWAIEELKESITSLATSQTGFKLFQSSTEQHRLFRKGGVTYPKIIDDILNIILNLVPGTNFRLVLCCLDIAMTILGLFEPSGLRVSLNQTRGWTNSAYKGLSLKLIKLLHISLSDDNLTVRVAGTKLYLAIARLPSGTQVLVNDFAAKVLTTENVLNASNGVPYEDKSIQYDRFHQEVIDMITCLLLTVPKSEFHLHTICRTIIHPGLLDQRTIVRTAVLDCAAVVGHLLGPGNRDCLLTEASSAEVILSASGAGASLVEAIHKRLAKPRLPQLDRHQRIIRPQPSQTSNSATSVSEECSEDAGLQSSGGNTRESKIEGEEKPKRRSGSVKVSAVLAADCQLVNSNRSIPKIVNRVSGSSSSVRRRLSGISGSRTRLPWDPYATAIRLSLPSSSSGVSSATSFEDSRLSSSSGTSARHRWGGTSYCSSATSLSSTTTVTAQHSQDLEQFRCDCPRCRRRDCESRSPPAPSDPPPRPPSPHPQQQTTAFPPSHCPHVDYREVADTSSNPPPLPPPSTAVAAAGIPRQPAAASGTDTLLRLTSHRVGASNESSLSDREGSVEGGRTQRAPLANMMQRMSSRSVPTSGRISPVSFAPYNTETATSLVHCSAEGMAGGPGRNRFLPNATPWGSIRLAPLSGVSYPQHHSTGKPSRSQQSSMSTVSLAAVPDDAFSQMMSASELSSPLLPTRATMGRQSGRSWQLRNSANLEHCSSSGRQARTLSFVSTGSGGETLPRTDRRPLAATSLSMSMHSSQHSLPTEGRRHNSGQAEVSEGGRRAQVDSDEEDEVYDDNYADDDDEEEVEDEEEIIFAHDEDGDEEPGMEHQGREFGDQQQTSLTSPHKRFGMSPLRLAGSDATALYRSMDSEMSEACSVRSAASHRKAMRLFEVEDGSKASRQPPHPQLGHQRLQPHQQAEKSSGARSHKSSGHQPQAQQQQQQHQQQRQSSQSRATPSPVMLIGPAVVPTLPLQRSIPGKSLYKSKRRGTLTNESVTEAASATGRDQNSEPGRSRLVPSPSVFASLPTKHNPYSGASFWENPDCSCLVIGRRAVGGAGHVVPGGSHQHYHQPQPQQHQLTGERRPLKGQHNIHVGVVDKSSESSPNDAFQSASGLMPVSTSSPFINVIGRGLFDPHTGVCPSSSPTGTGVKPSEVGVLEVGTKDETGRPSSVDITGEKDVADDEHSRESTRDSDSLKISSSDLDQENGFRPMPNRLSLEALPSESTWPPSPGKPNHLRRPTHAEYQSEQASRITSPEKSTARAVAASLAAHSSSSLPPPTPGTLNTSSTIATPTQLPAATTTTTTTSAGQPRRRTTLTGQPVDCLTLSKKCQRMDSHSSLHSMLMNAGDAAVSTPAGGLSGFQRVRSTGSLPQGATDSSFGSLASEQPSSNRTSGGTAPAQSRTRLVNGRSTVNLSQPGGGGGGCGGPANLTATIHLVQAADWETKVAGLEALAQLAVDRSSVFFPSTSSSCSALSSAGAHLPPGSSSRSQLSSAAAAAADGLNQAVQVVIVECRNLRSQVSRKAVQTLSSFFRGLGRLMDPHIETSVRVLLNKAGEAAAVFLRDEVAVALDELTLAANPSRTLCAFMQHGLGHKNQAVRLQTAIQVSRIVEQVTAGNHTVGQPASASSRPVGTMHIGSGGGTQGSGILAGSASGPPIAHLANLMERLVTAASQFLTDCNQETRYYGRRLLSCIMHQPEFDRIMRRQLTGQTLRTVKEVIDQINTKGVGELQSSSAGVRRQAGIPTVSEHRYRARGASAGNQLQLE